MSLPKVHWKTRGAGGSSLLEGGDTEINERPWPALCSAGRKDEASLEESTEAGMPSSRTPRLQS